MAKDNGYNSIPEFPIRFFLKYPNGGRNRLFKEYVMLSERDIYFDKKRNKAFELVRTQIDEIVTETSEEEYPFEVFISHKFEEEIINSKYFFDEKLENEGDSENSIAYKILLRDFIENLENFKNFPSYPESELLPAALIEIVKHAMQIYRQLFPNNPLERQAKKIIDKEEKSSGQTGYILKSGYRNKIPGFNKEFILSLFIAPETENQQWHNFFKGKYPSPKINLVGEYAYNHLWYFIKQLEKSEIFIEFPKQQWKDLGSLFTVNSEYVAKDFYKKHNYLKKINRKKIDDIIKFLKQ